MEILSIDQLLAQDDANAPLRMQPLAVLNPIRESYHALLYQPGGAIHASAARIGNSDQTAAAEMFLALLVEAVDRQSQIVVTPEYSVPWTVLRQVAVGTIRPPMGALWVLGCESTTPAELAGFRSDLPSDVRILHEPLDQHQVVQRSFIDPLVYVFWSMSAAGASVLCILVQFKTAPCRDPEHVELRHLYLGRRVYKFSNATPTISLIGIICSDSFELENHLVDLHCRDLLLIHIQLNQSPANPVYSAYRNRLYAVASDANVEVLSLNWAAGLQVEGTHTPWISIAGSAWYISPHSTKVTDKDVNDLHHDGVYYSLVDKRWHAFYFNYSPHLVLIEKQRVFSTGPRVIAPQTAPRVILRCQWDPQRKGWIASVADDGFPTLLQQGFQPLVATLSQMCHQDPLSVERAMELLDGPAGGATDWYTLTSLGALQVADEESMGRVTVSQETDVRRRGVSLRRDKLRKAKIAIELFAHSVQWPSSVNDLVNGLLFIWSEAAPHCNVTAPVGGRGTATVTFLGEEPDEDVASNIHAKLTKALRHHAALQMANGAAVDLSQSTDRLCVVLRRSGALQLYEPKGLRSITDPDTGAEDDLTRSGLQ